VRLGGQQGTGIRKPHLFAPFLRRFFDLVHAALTLCN
jgi:hypothetical protein